MSPTMQRYMRAQAVASGQDDTGVGSYNQAVLEINPSHPIVKDLDRMVKVSEASKELENSALLMYDVASMTSGYSIKDPKGFAKRVMSLMNSSIESSDTAVKDAEVVPEAVEEKNETETSSPVENSVAEVVVEDTEETKADSSTGNSNAEVVKEEEREKSE